MKIVEFDQLESLHVDMLIDARSPKEYEHSHVKNAQNFYALSDEEHKEVGTIYKNISHHHAKVLGASYICKNSARHLLELEKLLDGGAKIGIYCARGGLRSSSLAMILEQVGFRVYKIKDGYKGCRKYILDYIEKEPKLELITLFGNTGSGKTELIKALSPSVDLEGLANHQGSTFGQIHGMQPSMKSFQNELFYHLKALENEKVCFIEGESRKIGSITLPKALHEKMRQGVNVEIVSDMKHRVARIVKEYLHISDEYFFTCMQKIKPYMSKKVLDEIIHHYKIDDKSKVAHLLLENYYDKVYKKPSHVDFVVRFDDDMEQSLKELNAIKLHVDTHM